MYFDDQERKLFSWRSDPPEKPPRGTPRYSAEMLFYDDLCNIDELCFALCDMPSIKAMVESAPQITGFSIVPVRQPSDNLGVLAGRTVELNYDGVNSGARHVREEKLVTLAHELRHVFQKVCGCTGIYTDDRLNGNVRDLILYDRAAEADATVFSLAVAFEMMSIKGKSGYMQRAKERDRICVEMYLGMTRRTEEPHWDGRAADHSFDAYFDEDNDPLVLSYDHKVCDQFMERARSGKITEREPVSQAERNNLLRYYIDPMCDMPARLQDQWRERPNYRPDTLIKACDYFSDPVKKKIRGIERAISPGIRDMRQAARQSLDKS